LAACLHKKPLIYCTKIGRLLALQAAAFRHKIRLLAHTKSGRFTALRAAAFWHKGRPLSCTKSGRFIAQKVAACLHYKQLLSDTKIGQKLDFGAMVVGGTMMDNSRPNSRPNSQLYFNQPRPNTLNPYNTVGPQLNYQSNVTLYIPPHFCFLQALFPPTLPQLYNANICKQ